MSARVSASAHASLPEMSISLSSLAIGAAFVSTAMVFSPPSDPLGVGIFAGNARRDLDAAQLQVLLDLLVVLAAEPEAMRAHHVLLVVDLRGQPLLVRG